MNFGIIIFPCQTFVNTAALRPLLLLCIRNRCLFIWFRIRFLKLLLRFTQLLQRFLKTLVVLCLSDGFHNVLKHVRFFIEIQFLIASRFLLDIHAIHPPLRSYAIEAWAV